MRGTFPVKTQLPGDDSVTEINWPLLKRKGLGGLIDTFQLSVIQVDGEVGDVITLFVRINSTGRALTTQEKRKAKYSHSPLLACATRVAGRFEKYFAHYGILSASQMNRM